jgi:alpha-glucosidase
MPAKSASDWWRGAAIYQIYPRSFQDSNGDGLGDLAGITARLDHVQRLGVDAIWISPFFASPQRDHGYDVSDHCAVDSRLGSISDFDALLRRAHELGLKVIIDQIWSHTALEHAWFTASRQSRQNEFADWYVWADAKPDGAPPNNWQAWFGGSAWTWEPRRGQYYFHNFMPEMPDLNFHCVKVQDAILDVARFWLNRGTDGFRLDTANYYFHDRQLRDNPTRPLRGSSPVDMQLHLHNVCQPENLVFLERVRSLLDTYGARASVAEIASENDLDRMIEYTRGDTALHTAYSFLLLRDTLPAHRIAALLQPWQRQGRESWPAWALSNHDTPRVATRWALRNVSTAQRAQQLLVLLLCLRGTVFIYQGEELGLTQSDVPLTLVQDPAGRRGWPQHKGRDGCRTPMPWSVSEHAMGFSTGTPWLPLDLAHRNLAVDRQALDPESTLQLTRRAVTMRRDFAALRYGELNVLHADDEVLVFERKYGGERVLSAFNLGDKLRNVAVALDGVHVHLSVGATSIDGDTLLLPAGSALVMVPR